MHIQVYSIIIVLMTLTLFFLTHFNLTYFSKKSKTCFLTTMMSISMLDGVYLNNNKAK